MVDEVSLHAPLQLGRGQGRKKIRTKRFETMSRQSSQSGTLGLLFCLFPSAMKISFQHFPVNVVFSRASCYCGARVN